MLNLALSFAILLVQDTVIGPYSIPEILPATATKLPIVYGDTLYEDAEGTKYVFHISSGAKVYNPILYDQTLPFEIRWTPTGLVILNSLSAIMRVEMPAPQMPVLSAGSFDYVTYGPKNAIWGLYYLNNQVDTNQQGYETVGVWPPSPSIQNYFESHYGISDMNELTFQSVVRCQTNAPNTPAAKWTSPSSSPMKIKIEYALMTIDPQFRHWLQRTTTFSWAGTFDLNIDGTKDASDLDQFNSWFASGDTRADWNQNGSIDAADKTAFEAAFGGQSTPPPTPTDNPGGDGDTKAGGCTLTTTIAFDAMSFAFCLLCSVFAIFFVRGRVRLKG